MNPTLRLALLASVVLVPVAPIQAASINLFVDSAPNIYGSSDYAPWWDAARSAATDGTFVNMANSVDPANAGTLNFNIRDLVVYSFGDLGRRLHFVYWVPGETIASLTAANFEVSLEYVWDGVTYDFYNDYYGSTWLTPSSWSEYNGGVIGTTGFAWWGAYNVNTPEALEADIASWEPYQGDITLRARMNDGTTASLTTQQRVPEGGATALLLGLALLALCGVRLRRA